MFLSVPSGVLTAFVSEESYGKEKIEESTRFMEWEIGKKNFPRRESNPDRQGESLLS